MNKNDNILNSFLVDVFNEILKTEELCISKSYKNLSVREMHVIEAVCIAEEKGCDNSSAAIAKGLKVTAGTLTTAVSLLEKKGYLIRARDDKDKRIVKINTTESGRQAQAMHKQFHKEMIDAVLGTLTNEEATVFVHALGNISAFFRAKYIK